ncbi:hypothetical protein EPI10_005356 [Gossypium australe]|uniref:Uncharacterized protein n=1 Tax=Gossypium australe TaxID=47621 RepID=A0A5B6WP44_9ROSI|nr:hypothetical protein EPI10_005356 [Gossypium australe]
MGQSSIFELEGDSKQKVEAKLGSNLGLKEDRHGEMLHSLTQPTFKQYSDGGVVCEVLRYQ